MELQATERKEEGKRTPAPRLVVGGACLSASGLLFIASGASMANVVLVGVGVTMIVIGGLLLIKRSS
jgi:hypothetical protein